MIFWEMSPARRQDLTEEFLVELKEKEAAFKRAAGIESMTESQELTVLLNLIRAKFGLDPMTIGIGIKRGKAKNNPKEQGGGYVSDGERHLHRMAQEAHG